MIDAYEIGIRLALENGVSEGLAKVRQDLGMLDQAVAATVRGLAQLHAAAGAAMAGAGMEPPRVAAAVRPTPAGALPPVTTVEPAPAPAAAATRIIERERVASVLAVPSAASTAGTGRTAPPPAPMPPSSAGPSAAPAMAGSTTSAASPRPSGETPAPMVRVAPPAVTVRVPTSNPAGGAAPSTAPTPPASPRVRMAEAPRARTGHMPIATGGTASWRAGTPLEVRRPDMVPGTQAVSSAELTAIGRAMLRTPTEEPASARREAVMPRPEVPPDAVTRMASPRPPAMEERRWSAAPARGAQASPPAAAAPTMAPAVRGSDGVREQAQSAPMNVHGDVFLDGVLMGRWISEHMAREADRPPSGPTGFDARRSAAWPGATVAP